jgi:hypothetical protein
MSVTLIMPVTFMPSVSPACPVQAAGDRASVKEYLRLQSSALALAQKPDELAKAKPFAVEVRRTVCMALRFDTLFRNTS